LKRIVASIIIFALTASLITLGVTYAANEQQQLDDINKQIDQTQAELNAGKKKEKQLNSQINRLESQINVAEKEIDNIKGNIFNT